jgi:A/G-specific adenine glycosylase
VVKKREGKGIWENLYEFPLIETEELVSELDFMNQLAEMDFFDQKPNEIFVLHPQIIQHKLSHQNLYIRFFQLNFDVKLPDSKSLTEIQKLPFPIVIHNFMASNYFNSL